MNQGVSPVFIDWVTAVGVIAKQGHWMRKMLDAEQTKPIRSGFHQSNAVEYYPSGMRHYFSPHNPENPSILVATGECLRNMRREHDNDWTSKVVAQLARTSSHFSRIDLSVDIYDKGATARKLAMLVLAGSKMFGRRNVKVVQSAGTKGGVTVYVGSRTSPKYLRVYDKNAESDGDIPATRIEFELKSDASEQVWHHLSKQAGWTKVPGLFNGMLGHFADWSDFPVIEAMQYGEVITISRVEKPRYLETKEWLMRQIAPTFLRDSEGRGGELWAWFKGMIEEEL